MDLSIVIPIYNVEEYLKECLDSIVRQRGEITIQAILVNDGSQDHSSEIAKEFVSQYPQLFEYYKKDNGGLSDARNFGVKYARGTYLMFLDSDDYLAEDACLKIIKALQSTKSELLFFDYMQFDETECRHIEMLDLTSGFIEKQKYLLCQPTAWNKVIVTDKFKNNQIQFPVGIWYEDRATTGAYVNFVNSIYYLKEPLYYYRQRLNSIMNQKEYNPKMMDMIQAITYMLDTINKKEFYAELEYIAISNVLYQSGERLLAYQKKDELIKMIVYLSEQFPNWRKNKYFKKRSKLYQLTCILLANKQFFLSIQLFRLKNNVV